MKQETTETTWTAPELTEFDINERTQLGDGPSDDGTVPTGEVQS